MKPRFFASPAAFGRWLEVNHDRASEVVVGFWKKATGKPSLTWSESVDEALCFGWIDGVRRSVDEERYTIRFTPRQPRSMWSLINVRKVEALVAAGRMRPAGLAAFEQRHAARTGVYSFEQREAARLEPGMVARFKEDRAAWRFWEACPPGYRKAVTHWVTSAKRAETRARRLATLIADSAKGRRIPQLAPRTPKKGKK